MGRLSEKLTFANVMSVVAVFIALGGSAVAFTKLPKDSVGARQIKSGAVRSDEVKDFSLKADDFAKGALPAGRQGEKGEPGAQGQPGTPGAPGAPATKIYAFVRTGGCCGGAPPLDPPQLMNAHGITAAAVAGTGQYEVTVDLSQIPSGKLFDCVPMVSNVSADAAYPLAGEIGVGHPSGIPSNKLMVFFRNSAGTLTNLENGGGSPGFSIALFC
jgi:hypothetical protein